MHKANEYFKQNLITIKNDGDFLPTIPKYKDGTQAESLNKTSF